MTCQHDRYQFNSVDISAATADSADVVAWLRDRELLEVDRWNSIGREEYARAFTVAGSAGHNVVGDIYGALMEVIEAGGTEQDFAELITPILQEKGWLSDQPGQLARRVNLIYDTNLRVARGIGRWKRVQEVAAVLPYLMGSTVGDSRVRDEHEAFQGIVLPVTHPFWTEFWPPMFFQCRCDVIQLSRGQFRRRGLQITPEAEVERRAAQIRPQSWGNPAVIGTEAQQPIVDTANRNRVPGALPLDRQTLEGRGQGRWDAIMGLAIQQLLTGLANALR